MTPGVSELPRGSELSRDHVNRPYVAVRSETIDWFMCVISEVNDPSKEMKVRFMRKSGQYFLQSWKRGSESQQYFTDAPYHPLTIACVIPSIPSILKIYVIK